MIRVIGLELLLFLAPFALFAAYLLASKRRLGDAEPWRAPLPWLVAAGVVLALAGVFNLAATGTDDFTGNYRPTTLDDVGH